MHVIAPKSIRSLKDLEGKKVSVDLPNGGTFVTAAIVFERLGIRPNFLYIEQRIAMEKLRTGQIDAVIAVQGKPSKTVTLVKDDRLHLVPVDYDKALQGDYLPATLTSKGSQHRPLSKAHSVRRRLFHQVPFLPESALPPEVEGSFAVGSASRLATLAFRQAMA
jgi:hypothetical protein